MDLINKLPSLEEVKQELPLSRELTSKKATNDLEVKNIISGKSKRLLLIIGPCSADREDAVLEYTEKLSKVQERVKEIIKIVPRLYSSKPRTIGNGYKGMIHQPIPNGEENIVAGIKAVRRMQLRVIEQTGLVGADEMLYPELVKYFVDVLAYITIGARSTENQEHRLVASGLDMAVGVKNPIKGDVSAMLNAIETAQYPHHFVYNGYEVMSQGNIYAHAILRGYNKAGHDSPNYHFSDLNDVLDKYEQRNLENISLIIDTNHSNSKKQFLNQPLIADDVISSMKRDQRICQAIKGMMIESYLEDGCQPIRGSVYGKSITDPCLGWEETSKLIYHIADEISRIKK